MCGEAGVVIKPVTRSFGRGSTLLVFEDIPKVTCPHCRNSYFTARTMHAIERIKTLRASMSVPREVPVARFAAEVT